MSFVLYVFKYRHNTVLHFLSLRVLKCLLGELDSSYEIIVTFFSLRYLRLLWKFIQLIYLLVVLFL